MVAEHQVEVCGSQGGYKIMDIPHLFASHHYDDGCKSYLVSYNIYRGLDIFLCYFWRFPHFNIEGLKPFDTTFSCGFLNMGVNLP